MFNINSVQLENLAFSKSLSFQKKPLLEDKLNKLNKLTRESENMADTLEIQTGFSTSKGATEALMAASVHQKEIVAQMMSSNPEDSISLALAASIEAYGRQLENINAWTEGGVAVVNASLPIIFEYICQRENQDPYLFLEDLFQLVLIDFILNAEYYGMGDLLNDDEFMDAVGVILEFTGSGNHHDYFDDKNQQQIIDAYETVYQTLYDRAPNNSLMAHVFDVIETNGGEQKIIDGMSDEYYDNNGDIEDDDYISPMLTLTVLAISAGAGEVSSDEWDLILSGNRETIEQLVDPNDEYDNLIHYISVNQPPHNAGEGYWVYKEDTGYWDYQAPDNIGYEPGYLDRFFRDFPARELTEEEIEEVNRIGDQVKMLQQTLLYWLKICRDEQMAIAQNT